MSREYWGLSLDAISEEIWGIRNDAVGAHYIAFQGSREEARAKMIAAFTEFIDARLYRATSYGSAWKSAEDDDEDLL